MEGDAVVGDFNVRIPKCDGLELNGFWTIFDPDNELDLLLISDL